MSENYTTSTEKTVDHSQDEDKSLVKVSGRKPKNKKTRTDWERVDQITEEELDLAIKNDPDTLTLDDVNMSTLRVVKPNDSDGGRS